jgi:hypothetical protein
LDASTHRNSKMRFWELLLEDDAPPAKKVGREFNHLEDKVFAEDDGAIKVIQALKAVAKPETSITIKWDGNPTVYWGRDDDGTFRMVGKNNWGREEGKSSSPDELKSFIMSRGKGEDWRSKFASDMAAMWPIFEAATPKDFRGYVYGDLLFHPGKPYTGADGRISFTPNQVTYSVLVNSDTGRALAKAKVAVAAHKVFGYFGDKSGEDFDNPELFNNTPALEVFGLTAVSHRPAVGAENLAKIEALAKNQSKINGLLAPVAGMGYLRTEIYNFVNSQSKAKQLDNINTDAFLAFEQKTPAKAAKIAAHSERHPGVMDILFQLVKEIMSAKDEVIRELDAAEGEITATTDGKPGGEGYIIGGDKYVPRDRWTPFRAD